MRKQPFSYLRTVAVNYVLVAESWCTIAWPSAARRRLYASGTYDNSVFLHNYYSKRTTQMFSILKLIKIRKIIFKKREYLGSTKASVSNFACQEHVVCWFFFNFRYFFRKKRHNLLGALVTPRHAPAQQFSVLVTGTLVIIFFIFFFLNCLMQKHLNFYQHEQKDFINQSYRIVLLITNSATVNCVNGL